MGLGYHLQTHLTHVIYQIAIQEYFNLYRSGAVPNTWRRTGQDGHWVVLQNYYYPHLTCRLLPKFVECVWGSN